MKKKILITFVFILFLSSVSLSYASDTSDIDTGNPFVTEKAKVLEIISDVTGENLENPTQELKQVVEIKILTGEYKDQIITVDNHINNHIYYDIILKEGDRVTIAVGEALSDYELPEIYISGFERDRYQLYIALIFVLLLILIGGIKGIKSVLALMISILMIIFVMLPLILKGYSPILLSIFSAIVIATLTLFVIAGINIKSASAIIGTASGVIAAGLMAYIIGSLANLTGLSSHEATMLMYIPQDISFNFKGLLFAGIIIGTLGAVMDIAMSIASSMYEIREIEPNISIRDLITAGINIGKDIMGTMTNTLILAYTGTSIPLMLIFIAYDYPLVEILNMDLIATEIIRSIAGSIGLVLAIPFTAMTCGALLNRYASKLRKERIRKLRDAYDDDLKNMYAQKSQKDHNSENETNLSGMIQEHSKKKKKKKKEEVINQIINDYSYSKDQKDL
ncbi:MAG: YibE/F family protein [Clostridia bacterium]|nr:YibE/F family protein [Clostridia bacterium]